MALGRQCAHGHLGTRACCFKCPRPCMPQTPPRSVCCMQCPNLKAIQSMGAGVSPGMLEERICPSHVPLLRIVDPLTAQRMATFVLWSVINLQRKWCASFLLCLLYMRCCWPTIAWKAAAKDPRNALLVCRALCPHRCKQRCRRSLRHLLNPAWLLFTGHSWRWRWQNQLPTRAFCDFEM
jgi:hypothetical protein